MRSSVGLCLLVSICSVAFGQGGAGVREPDYQNLGILGLGVEKVGGGFVVRALLPGSPGGAAGIQAGDIIVGVAGRPFGSGNAVLQVIEELEKAEIKGKRPARFVVRRGEVDREVEVSLSKMGPHSTSCPKKCKKCRKLVEAGLSYLASKQEGNGCLPTELGGKTGKVVVTSLGGLAMIAAGVKPGRNNPLDKAAGYVLAQCGEADDSDQGFGGGGNWNQENWELAYGLMFLSEYAGLRKQPEILQKCAFLAKKIQDQQEESGGWAHGPGGPNALGYLELEIVGNFCLLGLGAAKKQGIELDPKRVRRALEWIEGTSGGDGGVAYSQRQGQKGFGEGGRTAGAIVAYYALGQTRRPFFSSMVTFFDREMATLPDDHVSPTMHILAGAMASHRLGKRSWKKYMKIYRPHFMTCRRPDGAFATTPTEESRLMSSNTDVSVGLSWTTASYVLILSLPNGNLPILLGDD